MQSYKLWIFEMKELELKLFQLFLLFCTNFLLIPKKKMHNIILADIFATGLVFLKLTSYFKSE